MSFSCPIHGYYAPIPGSGTVALCPQCAAPAARSDVNVSLDLAAKCEDAAVQAERAKLERLRTAGERLRRAVTALDSYAAGSFPCPLGHSREADAAVKAWDEAITALDEKESPGA